MTGKRFYIEDNGIWDNTWKRREPLTWKELCDILNKFQELSIDDLELIEKLKKENGQLVKEKERYKRLSEIRREEINNRVLTIKEFIENCSDNKVKKILEDLFYSEVKEYDLSAQNRKLLYENEQLKQFKEDVFTKIDMHLRMLPTARDNEFNEEYGDPSLYTGAIYMLETLKKELKE